MRAALIVAAVLLSNQANAKPLETGDRAFFLYLPIADTCAKILPLETVQKGFLCGLGNTARALPAHQ